MKFDNKVTIFNGATGADPISNPGNVRDREIFTCRRRDADDERPANRLVLGLEAPTAETVDVSLYALDDDDVDAAPADRHWYLIGQVAGLAGGTLAELTTNFVSGGLVYVRVTAETVTVDRSLLIRSTI